MHRQGELTEVCDFVSHRFSQLLLVKDRGDVLVEHDAILAKRNKTPVLHRTGGEIRNGQKICSSNEWRTSVDEGGDLPIFGGMGSDVLKYSVKKATEYCAISSAKPV